MISQETIERVKAAANVEEVVGQYVELRRRGAGLVGLCPFHDDHHPSLCVSPAKGVWRCFSCGAGGTAVDFVMRAEQVDFPTAIRLLAHRYGITLEETALSPGQAAARDERERLRVACQWAEERFGEALAGSPAERYLAERGLSAETIARYRLGYDDGTLHAKGYPEEPLRGAGLTRDGHQDTMAGRVVFPWHTMGGQVTGFGARLLDARTHGVSQKYVNSPDSPLFHKGRQLYGLYEARQAIARAGKALVVEGYMDVVQMRERGVENAVATCGTALTPQQAKLLKRLAPVAVVAYDSDEAGEEATPRACDTLLSEGVEARVVRMPAGEDPDSFARSHAEEELTAYLRDHEQDYIAYLAAKVPPASAGASPRAEGLRRLARSIALVGDPLLREEYVRQWARELGVSRETLTRTVETAVSAKTAVGQKGATDSETPEWRQLAASREAMLLRLVVSYGEREVAVALVNGSWARMTVAQYVEANLSTDGLSLCDPLMRRLLSEAVAVAAQGKSTAPALANLPDEPLARLAQALLSAPRFATLPEPTEERLAQRLERALLDFRMGYVERRREELMSEMADPAVTPSPESLAQLRDLFTLRQAYHRLGMGLR